MTPERKALAERITAYLCSGGLFNPEMAIHDRVRNLLIDCRAALSADTREEARPTIPADELQELLVTMNHARTFITSREKMHPDGVKLWDGLYDRLRALAVRPSAEETHARDEGRQTRECSCTHTCHKARGETLGKNWHCRVEAEHAQAGRPSTAEATPRDSVIEECIAVARAHDPEKDSKPLRRGLSEETLASIRDEQRGERIAAERIAAKLRALKEKP